MKWRVAIVQMDVTYGDPVKNREKIHSLLADQNFGDVDVIVLPELWSTGYDLASLPELCQKHQNGDIAFLQELALSYHSMVVGGSIAFEENGHYYNQMLVIDRDGSIQKEYRKIHLFRLMNEEKYLSEGETNGQFTLEGVPCSGFICYDIRFPEWIRTHVLNGSKVLFTVAEWPLARVDHWRTLLISRAIENQCYVIASNRVGSDPKNEFGGHSLVIDPWGQVLREGDTYLEEVLIKEIDLDEVEAIRQRIAVFDDRRPEMYTSWLD
ncbi:carbon-nitrogen family hydrolase [Salisediminibacterium beveridgei]|nr:carbon-nitrogen family hydrolase [Salisediminibacterium beveridgei]